MTDTQPSFGRMWQYKFLASPHREEIEVREFNGDDTAEAYARELSKSREIPIIIERHGIVDWAYIDEVDERT
jgi:hypothetical protein